MRSPRSDEGSSLKAFTRIFFGRILVPLWLHYRAIRLANVSIKNVPESVLARLRERAARNHRSLQGELLALVYQAADATGEGPRPVSSAAGSATIEEIAAEHRARVKEPIAAGPRAVDVIRAARDAR